MAINAYTTGTNTTLSNHNIDVKPDVQHGDQLYWNGTYNLFETDRAVNIDLSDYATRQFVQEQIAQAAAGGGIDLTGYATQAYVQAQLTGLSSFDGQYSSLTGLPNLFSGSYLDLTNTPTLFSGDYNDLINRPNVTILNQSLTLEGTELTISNNNTINLNLLPFIQLGDISVTVAGSANQGGGLSYDNTSGVLTFTPANQSFQLGDLTDVSGSSPQVGHVLKWNGTQWIGAPDDSGGGGGGGISLTDLSVTVEGTPSGNGGISYNSTSGAFTYTPPNLSLYQPVASAFDGNYTSLAGRPSIPTDIFDLGITDGTNGQVLTTDGSGNLTFTTVTGGGGGSTAWADITGKPTTIAGFGITDSFDTTDIDAHLNTSTATANQVLSWDGSDYDWVAQSGGGSGIALTDLSVKVGAPGSTAEVYGLKSDPSFALGKTYTLTANGQSYTYGPTTNSDRNYITGIGNLNVPGLSITSYSNSTYTNAVKLVYTPQTGTDQLVLADTNGWEHLSMAPGTYFAAGLSSGRLSYDDSTGEFTYVPPNIPSSLTDLGITDGTNGQVLTTDGAGTFSFQTPAGGGSYGDTDVDAHLNTSTATNGQVLAWNGTDYDWITSGGGGGGTSPIGWVTEGNDNELRVSSTFTELGTDYTVRSVSINTDNLLQIELARFSPVVTSTGQSLSWDETADQFSVAVDNPTDFDTRWIDSVSGISGATGVHATLSDYTTTGPSVTPAGGVDWTQVFSTNATATIVSNGTGLSGGTASATITFADDQSVDWTTTTTITYNWQNANATVSFANLSGKNFLETYTTVGYTVSITGLSDPTNATTTLTPTGGTLSDTSASGTMTFTDALHKDNNTGREIALSTEFSRAATVTGSAYTVTDTASDTTISATFTYPSFYIWTANNTTPPTRADIVDGNDFDSTEVTELGNQTKNINTTINNSSADARCFWLAVRTSATQPSTFETGPSSALLSTVTVTTGNTVDLEPDTPESGYTAEGYTLYGITLQPGDTYVRIS